MCNSEHFIPQVKFQLKQSCQLQVKHKVTLSISEWQNQQFLKFSKFISSYKNECIQSSNVEKMKEFPFFISFFFF